MPQKIIFGIDIGGTSIKLGVFDSSLRLIDRWRIPTRVLESGRYIFPDIAVELEKKVFEKSFDPSDIIGIGVAAPGPVKENGEASICVNLCLENTNIKDELFNLTGLPIKAINDANASLKGEILFGAAAGLKSAFLVSIGTGIGGALMLNGKIIPGETGSAGEIGHFIVNTDEKDFCSCGRRGCLEQYSSATGIVKTAKKYILKFQMKSKLYELNEITAKDVFDLAKEKDPLAEKVLSDSIEYLGMSLANIAAVFDPECFIISGGVANSGDYLIGLLEDAYNKFAFKPLKNKKIVLNKLKDDAGIYGAASLFVN